MALLGVSSNLPAVVGLPLGVVLIDEIGFSGVFAVGAITALAGAMIALAAPSLRVGQAGSTPLGPVLRLSQLRRSAVVFLGMAAGSSLLGSFLQKWLLPRLGSLASTALDEKRLCVRGWA